jgi:YD repeat-containing protein
MRRGWGGRHVYQLDYDDMNQLTEVRETVGGVNRTTRFAYDALGRRIAKHHREESAPLIAANLATGEDADDAPDAVDGTGGRPAPMTRLTAEETTWYMWDGDNLLAEGRGDIAQARDAFAVVYVHEPGSHRPAAQIRRSSSDYEGQVLLYWTDHLGTPQELTNERGELVWQVGLKAWGGIDRVWSSGSRTTCAFRASITTPRPACITTAFAITTPRRAAISIRTRSVLPVARCWRAMPRIPCTGSTRWAWPARDLLIAANRPSTAAAAGRALYPRLSQADVAALQPGLLRQPPARRPEPAAPRHPGPARHAAPGAVP